MFRRSVIVPVLFLAVATGLGASLAFGPSSVAGVVELTPVDENIRTLTLAQCRRFGEQQEFRYALRRFDSEPIELVLESLSCGCLKATLDGQPIKAGDPIPWTDSEPRELVVLAPNPKSVLDFRFHFALSAYPLSDVTAAGTTSSNDSRGDTERAASRGLALARVEGVGRLQSICDVVLDPPVMRCDFPETVTQSQLIVRQASLPENHVSDPPRLEGMPDWCVVRGVRLIDEQEERGIRWKQWGFDIESQPTENHSPKQSVTYHPVVRFGGAEDTISQEAMWTIVARPCGLCVQEMVVLHPQANEDTSRVRIPVRSMDGIDFRILEVAGTTLDVQFDRTLCSDLHWISIRAPGDHPVDATIQLQTDHPRDPGAEVRVVRAGAEDDVPGATDQTRASSLKVTHVGT